MPDPMHHRSRMLAVVLMLAALHRDACAAHQSQGPEPLCGPLCLAFILHQWESPVDGDILLRETNYSEEHGTTLYHLQCCAEKHGLKCLPVEARLSWIVSQLSPDTCAIVHRQNHFIVVSKQATHVLLVDPSKKLVVPFCAGELDGAFTALLLSRGGMPLASEQGLPAIVVWLPRLCLGISAVLIVAVCLRRRRERYRLVHPVASR